MRWKALLTGFRMHIFSPRNSTGLKSYSRLKFLKEKNVQMYILFVPIHYSVVFTRVKSTLGG